jgi:oligopeptide transport system substrate-binding protein
MSPAAQAPFRLLRLCGLLLTLLWLPLTLLSGCGLIGTQPATPIVVTEIITFDDGETVLITRVFTPTPVVVLPTPQPTIPVQRVPVSLDIGITAGLGALDPQRSTGRQTLEAIDNLYAGLTRLNPQTGRVEGELAQSWGISPDARVFRFELRDDIYWVRAAAAPADRRTLADVVPLRPVDAHDVVAAIHRLCDPQNRSADLFLAYLIEGCERVNRLTSADEAAYAGVGAVAVTARVLEVRLREPAAYFPAVMTLPVFRPIPRDLLQRTAEEARFDWLDPAILVSSGPFLALPPDAAPPAPAPALLLQRNPLWPADLTQPGNVERVALFPFNSRAAAFNEWQTSSIDLAPLPASVSADFLDGPLRPPLHTSGEVYYLGFNLDSPAFGVPEVRRAFSTAIDRERLLEQLSGGRGVPMRHLVPPGNQFAVPVDQVGLGYRPDYAFQQMLASGFPACISLGQITYQINATDFALQQAEALVDMWVEKLNCQRSQFRIEQVVLGTLLANTAPNAGAARPDLFDLAWLPFYPDPHDWFYTLLHCRDGENRPNRPCGEVDGWMQQAAVLVSADDRERYYRQLENSFFGENGLYPIAPLYLRGDYLLTHYWTSHLATETRLIGFQETPRVIAPGRYDRYLVDQQIKDFERER